ncbi:EscU/YscU/HrcU family type III secretion system export apparatus switch protein [Roseovarius salinarum]|uniref:EscU/YscU/HrcU family type III secretion system export apparatus switch protein n=1 Tax=Roseovarius salinarum TaxID=1981892 RepID=UPI000C33B95A|nr:flagellar type III secretion system protein FlhB [Roseovarius salinarum]
MTGGEDETDKSHEPTRHKLEEARRKGEVARSADLNTAAAYAGFLLAALAIGPASVEHLGIRLMALIDRSDALSDRLFHDPGTALLGGLVGAVSVALAGWFLIPAGLALASVLAQRSFVVAPTKLAPKLSRISPVSNAKNKYGPSGLFEFAKSAAKLMLYSVLLFAFLVYRFSDMAGALHAGPAPAAALMGRMMIEFMGVVVVIAIGIGAIDYIWQYHDHMRRNRMSHREVKEEHKQHEGDPHMKQERRQRGQEVAASRMMAEVPEADVVIVNPTHYAVALRWSREPGTAPVCVAKGVDHIARAIRELAEESGVPLRRDPPTARALHDTTRIGEEIDPAHYRAVAAAIRFAEAMRRGSTAGRRRAP